MIQNQPDSMPCQTESGREIISLSAAASVNMAEDWFEIVSAQHFWIRRRFDVLTRLGRPHLRPGRRYAEIGCGSGILQRQLETAYDLTVDGMDLGLNALRQSQATRGRLFYYNVSDCNPELREHYDVIFLFDVLEHIEDEHRFIECCRHHLKPGGILIINVPARRELYSNYDRAVGHVRRYHLADFDRLAQTSGMKGLASTYWGLPLYLLLVARKLRIARQTDAGTIVKKGMKPPSAAANRILDGWSRLEWIPQRLIGTSIMAILKKP